jgi:acyl-CoA thioester hydrolase
MPKTKLLLPERFPFTVEIPIRITDLNYGGHVGNDSMLSLIHEIRVQFLRHHGYGELDLAGVGLIMADVTIEFKSELFYGDALWASVAAGEFSRVGFELFYKLEKKPGERSLPVAFARTSMICYDYSLKKIVSVPKEVCTKLLA